MSTSCQLGLVALGVRLWALVRSAPYISRSFGTAGSWGCVLPDPCQNCNRDKRKYTMSLKPQVQNLFPVTAAHIPLAERNISEVQSHILFLEVARTRSRGRGRWEEWRRQRHLLQLSCGTGRMSRDLTVSQEDFQLILLLLTPASTSASGHTASCRATWRLCEVNPVASCLSCYHFKVRISRLVESVTACPSAFQPPKLHCCCLVLHFLCPCVLMSVIKSFYGHFRGIWGESKAKCMFSIHHHPHLALS